MQWKWTKKNHFHKKQKEKTGISFVEMPNVSCDYIHIFGWAFFTNDHEKSIQNTYIYFKRRIKSFVLCVAYTVYSMCDEWFAMKWCSSILPLYIFHVISKVYVCVCFHMGLRFFCLLDWTRNYLSTTNQIKKWSIPQKHSKYYKEPKKKHTHFG